MVWLSFLLALVKLGWSLSRQTWFYILICQFSYSKQTQVYATTTAASSLDTSNYFEASTSNKTDYSLSNARFAFLISVFNSFLA